ncbi:hypothetical protein H0H81_001862 [Sphagnurus paluster]|uniref:Phosphoglycerate mutase n=1 Tax=Sphagnurus paluster TaxID=117069 RepID=A0A9P7FZI0_9AGAR|nr:hypothetical protein H0H81_001862 [Sphagnurus paluster]
MAHMVALALNTSFTYTTVPGFFLQDNLTATGIPAIPPSFGLIDTAPDRWDKFFGQIEKLNKAADKYTSYKVFFLSRHGQGFHNLAESKYGTAAWDDYWSKLNGDGDIVWGPDPELTDLGVTQAAAAHDAWKTEIKAGIPLPGRYYVSPLTRALKTLEITIQGLTPPAKLVRPVVLEDLRETYGVHTCDKRRSKTYIQGRFPGFAIERGFAEEDPLWDADEREEDAHIAGRAKAVLDLVFKEDAKENCEYSSPFLQHYLGGDANIDDVV